MQEWKTTIRIACAFLQMIVFHSFPRIYSRYDSVKHRLLHHALFLIEEYI